ncbi:MAG: lytic murein transglycosylase B [Nevskia sp.]|nr:lytic murein transglycosylase B [Nevskia sp.]
MRRLVLRPAAVALALCAASAAADFSDNAKTPALLETLRTQYAFTPGELDGVKAALGQARLLPQLISAEKNNKEKTSTWEDYRPLHVNPANIANGLRFLQQHKKWLALAEQRYGVPPEVVTALLGVETKYGTFTGRFRVLDSLATLGYDHPTRAPFFFDQLTQFFVLCRDDRLRPESPLGSYAGAMGAAQFMPSNYRRLAVDFDGDGKVDLWSAADAIGSIANYLVNYDSQRSWQRGQPLLTAVTSALPPPAALPRNDKLPGQTVGALRQAGVVPPTALPEEMPAGLLELSHDEGAPEYWIALPNFYSIMSYNPRVFYAMAVSELANELKLAEDR